MDKSRDALKGVAKELAERISPGMTLGLGSGSTVAALLEELSPLVMARSKTIRGVATSTQIEMAAAKCGVEVVPFKGSVDLVIDGADQVDAGLNLVKGGGGALLKEKIVMGGARSAVIVAGEAKFARKLCENGVRVPVEVVPMARESAKLKLSTLGGTPEERLLPKGYPYFTESGNVILDTLFDPIDDPRDLEMRAKSIPGVAEVGIFTIKPIAVYRLGDDGGFELMSNSG
ncbi:MAG: ribose 5-phosphate isomerase A [Nitrososphaerota archaeon]|jgi:ribose 5-phosphate isomerase A|nr:ribose 5-phosphate isomerase A [Nitrososphaerota archaeon]MDG6920766.1 ribose 5-phosphate isomerase A [Nitrososphaerota archaeon]MDG6947317.1 ribose 5-phosphate isomerase A [Nitrososphaerota archaeon]